MQDRQQDGKKTIVSMFLYLFTNGIAMLVSLVTLPILSNWMSTSEMGIATSFITLKNILCSEVAKNSIVSPIFGLNFNS